MSPPERLRSRLERCWFCNERILPDDSKRALPGYNLTVHALLQGCDRAGRALGSYRGLNGHTSCAA